MSPAVEVFAFPVAIAALSLVGLTLALFGDGLYDFCAWLGLALPLASVLWAMLRALNRPP